jgi:HTH-type transcriptional repressor of NAD biosynthesis genes
VKRFRTGLAIGKFLPPHRGHKFLIETALASCDAVTVILCGKPTDACPPALRGEWLRLIHPTATVLVIDDVYDPADSQVWADLTRRWLGRAPEAVFTSEAYGERYASLMGSSHVSVDPPRKAVPISGTLVRAEPLRYLDFLEPVVREWVEANYRGASRV